MEFRKIVRCAALCGSSAVLVLLCATLASCRQSRNPSQHPSSHVLLYRHDDAWVYDDLRGGKMHEPLAPEMARLVDQLGNALSRNIQALKLTVGDRPPGGVAAGFVRMRGTNGVERYQCESLGTGASLPPSWLRVLKRAPAKLFLSIEPASAEQTDENKRPRDE